MYRASLLHTGMTEDEYLKHLNGGAGAQPFIYEQLYGPVASLCMNGNAPDDIVPALIRHAVELAVMDPYLKSARSPRFSSRTRFPSPFRAKRTGNCGSSTPAGMRRRSSSRARYWSFRQARGGCYPPSRQSADPPLKNQAPPPDPPRFSPATGAAHVHRTCIFRPRFWRPVTRNSPLRYA